MGILDLLDRENLVCTYCGNKPVVGVTFAIDAEIEPDGEVLPKELVEKSVIAVCKEHLPILQEKFEKDVAESGFVEEVGDGDQ
jgi:hypothetical protein